MGVIALQWHPKMKLTYCINNIFFGSIASTHLNTLQIHSMGQAENLFSLTLSICIAFLLSYHFCFCLFVFFSFFFFFPHFRRPQLSWGAQRVRQVWQGTALLCLFYMLLLYSFSYILSDSFTFFTKIRYIISLKCFHTH